ncbi:hypothetical protein F3Y22_tig00111402pilonHSYRG01384 [Hibiscus syriacus]|uniref:NAC domain-containing protein n=1 Tax=Hibiscus syriacus TaxID=106335 RepID=A0A6A2XUQ9_HIBSY|nr:hypothetical protein F3Y22_tig00111402pilonHSYRG01384 [Hibiscus syriacus]
MKVKLERETQEASEFWRTVVFYNGRAPSGQKTDWKMNEYKAFQGEVSSVSLANSAQLPLRPLAGAVHIDRHVPQHVKYGFELTESLPESSSLGDEGNQMTRTGENNDSREAVDGEYCFWNIDELWGLNN